ncbi:2-phospho-L-lactate transferase [Acuticoccus kandeliae]|uniref:2-phospho-L-lactate transferase n=1 Tax=Acuticoccus kandeliae TaxID=2073160 RepID=UPI00196B227B|nr:2-phospho-L-lactate transferase [Acuticoccus kandeliae]
MSGGRVIVLCGGVGGARMAGGLAAALGPGRLTAIVNVGDDFTHVGLRISPDLDTVLYTLSNLEDPAKGWGRRDETWSFMAALAAAGGPAWFQLGDKDLATHVLRTEALARGERLTAITARLAEALGAGARLLPATDDPLATLCETDEGPMPFQDYFVRRRCEPALRALSFAGADAARLSPEVEAALADPDLAALVIAPSNPYLSLDPILAIPGMRAAIEGLKCPRIAVSPIIGNKAVKGPLAKIMAERGLGVTAETVARHYEGLVDVFLADPADAGFSVPGIAVHACDVMMADRAGRARLAREALAAVMVAS